MQLPQIQTHAKQLANAREGSQKQVITPMLQHPSAGSQRHPHILLGLLHNDPQVWRLIKQGTSERVHGDQDNQRIACDHAYLPKCLL